MVCPGFASVLSSLNFRKFAMPWAYGRIYGRQWNCRIIFSRSQTAIATKYWNVTILRSNVTRWSCLLWTLNIRNTWFFLLPRSKHFLLMHYAHREKKCWVLSLTHETKWHTEKLIECWGRSSASVTLCQFSIANRTKRMRGGGTLFFCEMPMQWIATTFGANNTAVQDMSVREERQRERLFAKPNANAIIVRFRIHPSAHTLSPYILGLERSFTISIEYYLFPHYIAYVYILVFGYYLRKCSR